MFPGNPEICDGKDNDCEWIGEAGIDNGLDTDADGDGVSVGPGCLLPGNDCDDADPNNYPGNLEICDGQDNDCVAGNDDGLDIDVGRRWRVARARLSAARQRLRRRRPRTTIRATSRSATARTTTA